MQHGLDLSQSKTPVFNLSFAESWNFMVSLPQAQIWLFPSFENAISCIGFWPHLASKIFFPDETSKIDMTLSLDISMVATWEPSALIAQHFTPREFCSSLNLLTPYPVVVSQTWTAGFFPTCPETARFLPPAVLTLRHMISSLWPFLSEAVCLR